VYEVAWSDYCDWFLEMAKVDLRRADATAAEHAATWTAAADGLATLLRLLHPLMPFVTEEIWAALAEAEPNAVASAPLLITAPWPASGERDRGAEVSFEQVAALVRSVRNLRTESGSPAAAWLPLDVAPNDAAAEALIRAERPYVEALARVRPIAFRADGDRPAQVAASPLGAAWLGVDASMAEATAGRRDVRLAELDANIERLRALLATEAFLAKAPPAVVDRERKRLAGLEEERRQLAAG
jgi:valyl-tRNA synthetase